VKTVTSEAQTDSLVFGHLGGLGHYDSHILPIASQP
jgi:hypothetical protein